MKKYLIGFLALWCFLGLTGMALAKAPKVNPLLGTWTGTVDFAGITGFNPFDPTATPTITPQFVLQVPMTITITAVSPDTNKFNKTRLFYGSLHYATSELETPPTATEITVDADLTGVVFDNLLQLNASSRNREPADQGDIVVGKAQVSHLDDRNAVMTGYVSQLFSHQDLHPGDEATFVLEALPASGFFRLQRQPAAPGAPAS
jgi:hypothetical protein